MSSEVIKPKRKYVRKQKPLVKKEEIQVPKKRGRKPKVELKAEENSVILQLNVKNVEHSENKDDDYEKKFMTYNSELGVPSGYNEFDVYSSQPDKLLSTEEETKSYDENKNSFITKVDDEKFASPSCFWCCHSFSNTGIGIPIKYTRGVFYTKGSFCNLHCATSYIFNMNEYVQNIWEIYSLINLLGQKMNYKDVIKPSPPRECLKMFGGYMEIDEFRNFNKSSKIVNSLIYPMVQTTLQLEEINENAINKSFIPLNVEKVKKIETKLKLSRSKPLLNFKNTLDHTMNLKLSSD